ncbi:MAG: hypothetical protein PHN56_02395 [Candidatus Nanoarchaeia archaeon]|jgi:predicted membrane protein|nr:hypothetical protein [Candidatus Nanoarchaeia archaeon]
MINFKIHKVIAIAGFIVYILSLFYPMNIINSTILQQKTLIILIGGIICWFIIETANDYKKLAEKNKYFVEKILQAIYILLTILIILA